MTSHESAAIRKIPVSGHIVAISEFHTYLGTWNISLLGPIFIVTTSSSLLCLCA